ncbi:CD4-specific ankyrin repeat protein D1.1, partial [Baffinella frigidus]
RMLRVAGGQADAERERMNESLCRVAGGGEAEEVQRLIDGGADVESKASGFTALHLAAVDGHGGVVEILLAAGADVAATAITGQAALYFAAMKGHAEVAGMLLGAGADVAATDDKGFTALEVAAIYGHEGVARVL